MEGTPDARAPLLLTIVGWLTILSGLLQMVAGVLFLIFHDDIHDSFVEFSSGELTAFGIAVIVFGLIYVFVGRGFLRLNAFALGIGLFFSALAVIGDFAFLLGNDSSHAGIIASLILNVIVLIAVISGFSARGARA